MQEQGEVRMTIEDGDLNVVTRLKQKLADARKLGFKVRMEVLDDEQPSWCEIAGVPTLFVDLSQTAAEQLRQVSETLSQWQSHGEASATTLTSPQTGKQAA
jgi:hypothetical protein